MSPRAPARPHPSARRVTAAASSALTAAVLPVFLVGALADPIGDELGFGTAGAGLALTVFFGIAALTAVPMGRLTERLGASRAMRIGAGLSGTSTLAIGALAQQWWHLAVFLAVGASAVGLADTSGARAFTDAVRAARHGLAFGAKEASVPAASMLAGISIPLLAERFGWRWSFALGACLAPVVVALAPAGLRAPPPAADPPVAVARRRHRVWFAAGVGLAAAASTAAATLFVPAVGDRGWSAPAAGALLAVASVVAIGTRLGLGWVSDRAPSVTWWNLAAAIGLGAVGALLLAVPGPGALVPVGALLVLGAGWGWSGLAFLAAVRAAPGAPAVAAGAVLTGLAAGGVAGPAAFGLVAARATYGWAWVACGLGLLAAALITAAAGRPQRPGPAPGR